MTVRILAVWQRTRQFHDREDESGPVFNPIKRDHTVNSCAVGEYKSELSGADIIIASTHIAGEITVTGNKYVVGVRNMLLSCRLWRNCWK